MDNNGVWLIYTRKGEEDTTLALKFNSMEDVYEFVDNTDHIIVIDKAKSI